MLVFDHGKLARRQPREMKRFRRWLLEAEEGSVSEVAIVHENNGSCCRLEAWEETASAILNALKPPVPQVFLNLVGMLP
ncbi:MAG TPA: hypothetical protein VMG10_32850 [Gemmataceae bacterium]|nr:hypothetical protein [Gemmataceae bacterium]